MTSARSDDLFSQALHYERPNQDNIRKACFAAFSASLATVNFGYALGFTAEAGLSESFSKQNPTKALECSNFDIFASMIAIGALVGGLLGGYSIDKIGRKSTIILTSIFYTIGWLLITFSKCYDRDTMSPKSCESAKRPEDFMLYSGRFFAGVGVGLSSLAVPVYIAEISSARTRGALGNVNQLSINLGFVIAYTIGFKLDLPYTSFVPIVITLLNVFLIVCFLPETPRWLLVNNRRHDAILALYWLRGADYQVEEECFEIECAVNFGNQDSWEFKDLKTSIFYWPLMIGIFLMFFQEYSGINCILFYCSKIFYNAGIGIFIDLSTHPTRDEILSIFVDNARQYALFVSLTLFISTGISCLLVDRIGRRKLLLSGSIVMFISMFTVGLYCYKYPEPLTNPVSTHLDGFSKLALACVLIYIAGFSVGWGPLPWLLMSELFPIKTRAIATSIVTFTNWLLVFASTSTFCYMTKWMKPYGAFWFFMGIILIGFLFTLFYVPETRGRPLEDVSEMFLEK